MTLDSMTVNQVTAYSFTLFPSNGALPGGCYLTFTFPAQAPVQAGLTCAIVAPETLISGLTTCSVSGQVVTMQQISAVDVSGVALVALKLTGIQNPPSATPTPPIKIALYDSGGGLVDDTGADAGPVIVATPGILTPTLTSNSAVVGAQAIWTFQVVSANPVLAGGVVEVTFPLWTAGLGAGAGGDLQYFRPLSTPSCVGVTGINPALVCNYDTTTLKLTVTGGFAAVSSLPFTFTVQTVNNPPVGKALSGFKIYTKDSLGGGIDTCLTALSPQPTTPGTIVGATSSGSKTTVQQATAITLIIPVSNPLASAYNVEVDVPGDMGIIAGVVATSSTTCLFKTPAISAIVGLTIKMPGQMAGYCGSGSRVTITFTSLKNPASTKPSGLFNVRFTSNDGSIVDSGAFGAITATPNLLLKNGSTDVLQATSLSVGAVTTYNFQFSMSSTVPIGAAIQVIFPADIKIASRPATQCPSVGLNLGTGAQCQVTGQTLIVTSGFPSSTAGNIQFSLDQITNPSSTTPTAAISISTCLDSTCAHYIDTVTNLVVNAVPAALQSASVTASSYVTGQSTTYSFELVTTNPIPIGGSVQVSFPNMITIQDTTSAASNCVPVVGFQSGFSCTATVSSVKAVGFTATPFSPGPLKFSVANVVNPPSTKIYQSFGFFTYNSAGSGIDALTVGIGFKCTTANSFKQVQVTPASLVNAAVTAYTFAIKVRNQVPPGSNLVLQAPAQILLTAGINCSGDASSCSLSGSTLTIVLGITVTKDTDSVLNVVVTGVKNSGTTAPSDSFQLASFTSDGFAIDQSTSNIIVTTTQPAPLQSISIQASNPKVGNSSSYTIAFTPISTYPIGTSVSITVPAEFIRGTIVCSSATLDAGLKCAAVGPVVTLTGGFPSPVSPPDAVSIALSGLTNPGNVGPTSAWVVLSATSGYQIDQSNTITSAFLCSSPCATCQTTDVVCTSCLAASAKPYFYDGDCHTGCKDGFTATSATECTQCQDPCVKCAGSVSKCTSCVAPKPYLYSDTCNSTCQPGNWGDGSLCAACSNPCLNCSSASDCLSCTKVVGGVNAGKNTYLWGTTCILACNSGYLTNTSTFVCEQCDLKCASCSGTTATCTLCVDSKKVLNGDCVTSCPANGKYLDSGTVCEPCDPTCETCSGTVGSCVTCSSTAFLYNNTCLGQCPTGTTVPVSGTCQNCLSSCKLCAVSAGACTDCYVGKVLYNNQCVDSCPGEITVLVSNQCQSCDSSCLKCSGTISTCTACISGEYLYNAKCLSTCPTGTTVPTVGACLSCDPSCSTCAGKITTCKSCYSGMVLYNGTCISECPVNITVLSGSLCVPCDSSCLTCAGTALTCTSCKATWYLRKGVCLDSCPPGVTIVSDTNCLDCNSSCLTCSEKSTKCSTCPTNNYLYTDNCFSVCPSGYAPTMGVCQLVVVTDCATGCSSTLLNNSSCDIPCNLLACNYDNGHCVTVNPVCIDGEYRSGTVCLPCQYPCSFCNSSTSCISCKNSSTTSNLMLINGNKCEDSCPAGTTQIGITCQACDSTCATCVEKTSKCLTCKPNLYLYNNKCINACPQDVTIMSGGDQCSDCVDCKTCETATTTCTSCPSNQVLFNSSCRTICPDGWTITAATENVCQQCLSKCQKCLGSISKCTSCPATSFLYLSDCVSQCPPQITITTDTSCVPCSSACATCQPDINTCTSCPSGRVLYAKACLAVCPDGYESISGVCTLIPVSPDCASGCTPALFANKICDSACNVASCYNDNTLCLPSGDCPSGQYRSGTACFDCSYPCNFCLSSVTCSSCKVVASGPDAGEQLLLYNGKCDKTCPAKTMQSGLICEDCDSSCASCAVKATNCVACDSTHFLYQGKCLNGCPVGSTVAQGQICVDCSTNCQTCTVVFDRCTTCPAGKLLSGTACLSACPDGATLTSAFLTTCQSCQSPCQNCSKETTTCTSCVTGKALTGTSCVDTCPAKTTVRIGDVCSPCQNPCVECEISVSQCTSCIAGTALHQGSCLVNCPTGYEARLGVCTQLCAEGCTSALLLNTVCDVMCNAAACNYDNSICNQPTNAPCLIGQYRDVTVCKSCVYPCNTCTTSAYCDGCLATNDGTNTQQLLYTGSCLLICPDKTYKSGIVCFDCHSSCAKCSGALETECTACPSSYKLYQGKCINACPYGATVENAGVCLPCNSTCQTCAGLITTCISCPDGSVLSAGTCYPECPPGYTTTATSSGSCLKCSGSCSTCQGETTSCTSCSVGVLSNSQCLSACPVGFTTLSTDIAVCYKCLPNCAECSQTIDHCTSCSPGQILTSTSQCQVKLICPDAQTLTPTSAQTCVPCVSPCHNCDGDTQKCTSCVASHFLTGNSCSPCDAICRLCVGASSTCSGCFPGKYLQGTQCLDCDANCLTCEGGAKICLSCESTAVLSSGQCQPCDATCKTCSGTTSSCTSCQSPLFLVGAECLTCSSSCKSCTNAPDACGSCNDGSFLKDSSCLPCDKSCHTCIVLATNCQSCGANQLLLSDNTCVSCDSTCRTCSGFASYCTSCVAPKFLMDNNTCQVCSSTCVTCSGSSTNCTACESPKILVSGQCLSCDPTCSACSSSPSNCVSCVLPLVLYSGQCLGSCPERYYGNGSVCVTCSSTCKGCINSPTSCTSCPDGYRLIDTRCIKSCSVGAFLDGANCVVCSLNCVTCENRFDRCTSCSGNQVLNVKAQCEVPCVDGYTRTADSNGTCLPCDSACTSCSGATSYCTVCKATNYYLFQGQCLAQCPSGVTVSLGSICAPCAGNCLTCTNSPGQCLTCNSQSYLYGNQCLTVCPKGYQPLGTICSPCPTSDCLPVIDPEPISSTNITKRVALPGNTDFNEGKVPFPFIDLTAGSVLVVGVAKLVVSGVQFMPSAIALWGITAASSWVVTGTVLGTYNEPSTQYQNVTASSNSTIRRELVEIEASGDQLVPSLVLILLICGAGVHILLNLSFFCLYFVQISRKDEGFKSWRTYHKPASIIIPIISLLLSFHFSRLFYSALFGLDTFKATFDQRKVLVRPLAILTYISLICTSTPIIAAMVILLVHYSPADQVWMLGLDCLIVTSLLSLVLLLEIRKLEEDLAYEKGPDPFAGLLESKPQTEANMRDLVNLFPTEDVSGAVKAIRMTAQQKKITRLGKSQSGQGLLGDTRIPHRRFSYPLMSNERVEIRPESLAPRLHTPRILVDEPANEESLFQKQAFNTSIAANESTFIQQDEVPPCNSQASEGSDGEELLSVERNMEPVSGEIIMRIAMRKTPKITLWRPLKSGLKPLPAATPLTVVANMPDEKCQEPPKRDPSPPPKPVVQEIPRSPSPKPIPAPQKPPPVPKSESPKPEIAPKLEPVKAKSGQSQPKIAPSEAIPAPVLHKQQIPKVSTPSPALVQTVPREIASKAPFEPPSLESLHADTPLNRTQPADNFPPSDQLFTHISLQDEHPGSDSPPDPTLNPEAEIDTLLDDLQQSFDREQETPIEEAKEGEAIDTAQYDMDRAVPDSTNPDIVIIPHKYKGYRLKVKNDFNRARIVDLENRVVQSLPPIDPKKYDLSKTIIDETDPQYATLISNTGERVRVKRDFGNARIVNLEKRVYHPHSFLIGQTIEREEDFQFTNAYADPADPEVVVVMHNETGEDVRVRKTYHGAVLVDEEGRPIGPGVDRNEYDIPSTVVDKEDVHVSSLKHKVKKTRVRVRRDFRGAKIIDLERRKEQKTPEIGVREPEENPFDPDFSLLSQPDSELRTKGWVSPRSRRPANLEISEMFPTAENPEDERLEHLARIIDRYDNEEQEPWRSASPIDQLQAERLSSGDLSPKSRDASKKFFKKPIYHNTGLDRVYGDRAKTGFAQVDDSAVVNEYVSSKKRIKKKVAPLPHEKLRNMEKVYLQRMEVGKRPDTTISRVLAELEDGTAQEELIDSLNSRFQTDRAHLSSVGEEIVRGGRGRVVPFLQTPRQDEL